MDYIKQEEYLLDLAEELKYLSPKDATKVLQYYQTKITNAIEYGEKEEDVLKRLPSPAQVAKDAYESHSINYLEIRKKQFKRKQFFSKIIDTILSAVIIVSFFVVMYFIVSSIVKMGSLVITLLTVKTGLDKFISSISVLGYLLIVLLLTIYVIDIFIIILFHFLSNLIKLKNEDLQRKIFTFTITGFIEEKTKRQKIQLKVIISIFVITVILMVVSYVNKGYLYNSLNGIPSNETTYLVEESIESIEINGYKANIYLKHSDSNDFKIVHQYEFKDELKQTNEGNKIKLEIHDSTSYDILDILKEPVQNIIIYVPNTESKSINIKLYDGVVDATGTILNNVNVDVETKGLISFVDSSANKINVEGYNIALAVQDSVANEVSYTSTKGQFVINNNTNIQKLEIKNNQSTLKFEDSVIGSTTLTNTSGKIEFINIKGEIVNFVSQTSQNFFTDCVFKDMNFDISSTCSLALTRVVAESLISKCSGQAYLIIDYVKINDVLIESTSSNLFLTGIGSNYPTNEIFEYNNYNEICNVTVKNKYNDSKTEILDCVLNTLSITQEQGYLVCKKSNIKAGTFNLVKCNIVDLINLDGEVINLYLTQIATSITIDNEEKNQLVYKVKSWDELSYANMIKNDDTINFVLEENE